ncbi:MAG TPA: polyribonucleotide nucleotidyltransferase [Rhodothermia bacterium]
MIKGFTTSVEIGEGKTITLETGRLAKQADGAVVARLGDTMVLAAAVVDVPRAGIDFFPLTVEYREKFFAGGKIPGGFIKREGRPSDKEILSARLIDRCIRPLFPDGFRNEVQIIVNVISADPENDSDVVAGVASSAALMLSGAPFRGPVGEVRVGRVNGAWVINPTMTELDASDFNLVVAGRKEAIVMVEGEMSEVSEEDVLSALEFAHAAIRRICQAQLDLVAQAGAKEPVEYQTTEPADQLVKTISERMSASIDTHIRSDYEKRNFYEGISDLKKQTLDHFLGVDDPEAGLVRADASEAGYEEEEIKSAFSAVEKDRLRKMILNESKRLDGRRLDEIRPIWSEVAYLPRVHGSAIFTRGETQVLASVTLGSSRDVQAIDQVFDNKDKRFFLHYNFPPFCTGEAKPIRGVSRREVGHGYLAERALKGVMPAAEDFPYTVRLVSEVLESNGSSSMATVCAGTLALMDAGVPIKKAVAGIAMGLIAEDGKTAVLSDILGTEDHLGDMDFKVTGTADGITACQMDIKIDGLSFEILRKALLQARDGRLHILSKMNETLSTSRENLSQYAPRLFSVEIDAEFIGAIIGPGGKVIQGIQRETDTKIDIEERDNKGYVTIAATDEAKAQAALNQIRQIVTVPEVGEAYEGHVLSVEPFGAIVEILPGKTGLLHVSELDYGYVENVEDYLKPGDTVKVKLIEMKDGGKLRLSRKPFLEKPEGYVERPPRSQDGRSHGGGDRRQGDRGRRDGRHGGGGGGGRDRRDRH